MKNKLNIPIAGMHCRSCEILLEESLKEIPEVERAVLNFKKGSAEIFYGLQKPNMREIENAVRQAGYEIGTDGEKPFFSRNPEEYKDLAIALLVLLAFYVILKNLGLTNINLGGTSNPSGLGVVFLVGLTAGLSTCMALVGGLILGISARHSEQHPEATPLQKFRPHIFFNLGRVGGYALLGGVLGSLGSVLQLSGGILGVLTIVVGIVMLALGMKLVGIFPRMENGGLSLPTGIAKALGIKKHEKEYSHKSSMVVGALTFFLPCGFTQAMQLYAISTGSFAQGFLIMGLFALGTAPGLLSVGGFASAVKGIFAKRFFKFAGVLVIFLAFFNIANGYNLTGWQFASSRTQSEVLSAVADPNVTMENGVQVVRMKELSSGYSPNKFTIKKGVPVKWVIDAQAPNSCASSLTLSKLGIRKTLKAGENIIEFTPTEAGKLPFSCAMGMYTGVFNVVDENGVVASANDNSAPAVAAGGTCGASGPSAAASNAGGAASCGSGGGCGGGANGGSGGPASTRGDDSSTRGGGCGGSGKPVVATAGTTQTAPAPSQTAAASSEQVISTTYTYNNDIQPNTFKVKAGKAVKLVIDVKENGAGCMSTVALPGLSEDVYQLRAGKTIEFAFTPSKPGVYQIACAMGVPRGTITVE
jgi:sulfite exporter TauE/SafE/plastocyanin domain-containing protein/copper chaperone CopZ